jgi:chitinase
LRFTYLNIKKSCLKQQAFLLALFFFVFPFIARADLWSTGYYPGWEQASMPASNIDFTALTHIIHFSLVPDSDGTLNSSDNGITTANSADIVSRAHVAGKKVLICVGGAGSESGFQGATSSANLPTFINSLTNFMATRGYDGVDIDWEPLPASDTQQYTNLVNGLWSALSLFPQHKLLTVAAGAYPPYGDPPTAEYVMFAALQSKLDQINIMTYDLSGPYEGWVTWFNSPIYDGGYRFPSTGGLVPSVDGAVGNFITNGVAPNKLGIGVAFYGYIWTGGSGTSTGGVTQPRQSWTNAPTVSTPDYSAIMTGYYQSNLYHWDNSAQAAYLSITNSNPANDMFISYDDQRTCQSKVSYARNHGLGGVMIWELAQDYQSGQPDPLLQALKQALATPGLTTIQFTNQSISLGFSSLPLGSYRIQWTGDLIAGVWNTLIVTNVPGSGGPLQVTDTNSFSQPQRFYRVQTPP